MKLAASLILAASVAANASATATSEIVGVTKQVITPGLQTVAITLTNPTVIRAKIVSHTGDTLTFDVTSVDLGSLLVAGKNYYVEIEEDLNGSPTSAFVGDRFDINETATGPLGDDEIRLETQPHNTLALPLSANILANYRASIKEHVTIGGAFGTKGNTPFTGTLDSATADQVITYDPATGGFKTFYLLRDPTGTIEEWWQVGSAGSKNGTIIPPALGLFLRRNGATNVNWQLIGNVRANAFAMPLGAGFNFVSMPFPTDASPQTLQMTHANGFTGSLDSATADQIILLEGFAYATYYLLRDPTGTVEQWTKIGGGSTDYSGVNIFTPATCAFLRKVTPDSNYIFPLNFSP